MAAAKKEKVTKEVKEGERKSGRTPKAVQRLTASPTKVVVKKKATATTTKKAPTKTKAAKGTKKSKKDDGPKAKRALSAYMYFVADNRAKVKKANPEATFGELGKLLGEAWSDATAADKKKYEALAAKDKVRYEKEKAALEK